MSIASKVNQIIISAAILLVIMLILVPCIMSIIIYHIKKRNLKKMPSEYTSESELPPSEFPPAHIKKHTSESELPPAHIKKHTSESELPPAHIKKHTSESELPPSEFPSIEVTVTMKGSCKRHAENEKYKESAEHKEYQNTQEKEYEASEEHKKAEEYRTMEENRDKHAEKVLTLIRYIELSSPFIKLDPDPRSNPNLKKMPTKNSIIKQCVALIKDMRNTSQITGLNSLYIYKNKQTGDSFNVLNIEQCFLLHLFTIDFLKNNKKILAALEGIKDNEFYYLCNGNPTDNTEEEYDDLHIHKFKTKEKLALLKKGKSFTEPELFECNKCEALYTENMEIVKPDSPEH